VKTLLSVGFAPNKLAMSLVIDHGGNNQLSCWRD